MAQERKGGKKFGSIDKPLVGKTFGYLTVLEDIPRSDDDPYRRERCRCVCGNEVTLAYVNLVSFRTTSCGCKNLRKRKAPKKVPSREYCIRKPAVGKVFGRLTVLEDIPPGNGYRHRMARCKCLCGKECVVLYHDLKTGATQSCGCLKAEKVGSRMRIKWRQIYTNIAARKAEDKEVYADLYRDVMHGITCGSLSFDEFCKLLDKTLDKKKDPLPQKPKPHRRADYGEIGNLPEAISEFYTPWATGKMSINEVAFNLGVLPYNCKFYMVMYENQLLFEELERIQKDGKDKVDTSQTA